MKTISRDPSLVGCEGLRSSVGGGAAIELTSL
jgi:hypothetical protein